MGNSIRRFIRDLTDSIYTLVPFMVVVLVTAYLIVAFGSGVIATSCTEITQQSKYEEYLDTTDTSNALETLMAGLFRDQLKADSMRVILYSQDKSSTIQIASVVRPDSGEELEAQKTSIVSSPADRQRLSRHQARECSFTDKKDAVLLSCPLVDNRNFLLGMTLVTYRRALNRQQITTLMAILKLETPSIQETIQ